MKDLFMCLLLNVGNFGKIIEANMFKGGEYSNVVLKNKNGTYEITVIKKGEVKEDA